MGLSRLRTHFIAGSMIVVTALPALATQPPRPGEIEALEAQGLLAERVANVTALANHRASPELSRRIAQRLARIARDQSDAEVELKALPPGKAGHGLPSTGDLKMFALLIEFEGHPHSIDATVIDEMLFGDGEADNYPRESLANFYERSSYGLADLGNGTTLGWFPSSIDRDATPSFTTWEETAAYRESIILEAIEHFDAQGHDFSQYDNDGDGDIDYFIVYWTGPDTGWGSFWWAYRTSWNDDTTLVDGKTFDYYSWQWEANEPEVVIHETGHGFGLPDLYDYYPQYGVDGGVGGFDVMHSNVYDHNCFSKWMLGWLEPTVVAGGSGGISLAASATSPACVLVWPGGDLSDLFSEIFLIENRQAVANDDGGFEPDGLAIWHVDATLDAAGELFAYDNSLTTHKYLRLMEADGLEDIESNGSAEAADLYGAGNHFGPSTTPSSAKYNGYPSCIDVGGIVDLGTTPGDMMAASVSFVCSCPSAPAAPVLTAPSDGMADVSRNPLLTWTDVPDAGSYRIEICRDGVDCRIPVATGTYVDNQWTVSPALEGGLEHFWRVRSGGSCDASQWSGVRSFTTVCDFPELAVPNLASPWDGAVDVDLPVMLLWYFVPDAEEFEVELCEDSACAVVGKTEIKAQSTDALQEGNFWYVYGLQPETQYWWRVRAIRGCELSDWSEIRTFTTRLSLDDVELISPEDDAVNVDLQPTFQWSQVENADRYEIWVKQLYTMVANAVVTTTQWTVDVPLIKGTRYNWIVEAVNDEFSLERRSDYSYFDTCSSLQPIWSETISPPNDATDVPLAPTLTWEPSEAATSTDLEVCADSSCAEVIRAKSTWNAHWTVSPGLSSGTTYYWRLRSHGPCGPTEWNTPYQFTTTICPTPVERPGPKSPGFGAHDVPVDAVLNWTDWTTIIVLPSEVEVCTDENCDTVVRSEFPGVTDEWQVSPALETSTQYWWRVRFLNICGPGPWSPMMTFTTDDCAIPATPSLSDPGVSVASGTSYQLDWGTATGATGYSVQESASSSFDRLSTSTRSTVGSSLSYTHHVVGCFDETWYYRMRATNACSMSPWSGVVEIIVESDGPPAAPTGLSPPRDATDQPPTLTLDWEDVDGAVDYDVRVCSDGLCRSIARSKTVRESQWTVSPALDEYTPYSWQVRATNDCGEGPWTDLRAFQTGCAVPSRPLMSDPGASVVSGQSYTVSWGAVTDATAYHVQEDLSPEFGRPTTFEVIGKTSKGFSHANNGCDPDTYYYRMVAASDCGFTEISDTVDMQVLGSGSLAAPVLSLPADAATGVDTDAPLAWDEVSGADEYLVEVCSDPVCSTIARSVTTTTNAWTVAPTLDEFTLYSWRVQAANSCATGPWSAIRSFETGCDLPATPKVVDPGVTAASAQKYVVSWSGVVGATGYTVYEATNRDFLNATGHAVSASQRSMLFANNNFACSSRTYFYRVVAHNSCGASHASVTVDMVVTGLLGGDPCDTGLDGVCASGITECRDDQLVCTQATQPSTDLCDGLDNDCDPSTLDGSGERWFGAACDGLDGDYCQEGVYSCLGGARSCSDRSLTTLEICYDGIDNDCDGHIDCGGDLLFGDGFESGDVVRWSVSVP